nr:TonB-dependent receptor [uncultured Carboxylicivirga sp.]
MKRLINYKSIIGILLFCFPFLSHGQESFVATGGVLDANTQQPLVGANVVEKGTYNGTITDIDGNYQIKISVGDTLVFSFLGYENQEFVVNSKVPAKIFLQDESRLLDDLVVVGYGVQKKSDVTGAIASVKGEDISSVPVASAVQALQGKASGVQIVQNTGAPGASTMIKIRGTGTVNDSDPLYVVDGFITDNINHINPADIANIEILKDAASCAVYGSRSANGVVLVTTKSGESGKTRITFDSYMGFSSPWRTIPVMNTQDYALMLDYINGTSDYSANGQLYYSKDDAGSLYFDDQKFQRIDTIARNSPDSWWNAITQTGIKQQYNLSISGGNEKNKYLLSTSYYNEKGIVRTSDFSRINVRLNLNNKISPWLTANTNVILTNNNQQVVPQGSSGVLKRALYQSPMVYTYNSRGYYSENHPIAMIDRSHNSNENYRVDLNFSLTAKMGDWASYQFKVSDYVTTRKESNFSEVGKLEEDFYMPSDISSVYKYSNLTNKWEVNNLINLFYNNEVHDINFLIGQTLEGFSNEYTSSTSYGTADNQEASRYPSSAFAGFVNDGYARNWSSMGFVSRINYSLYDRYLLQANFRADASSIFAKSQRWGLFPSVSLGWKFSSESFLENVDWLTIGKIRLGWGQLGNNRIDELSRYTLIDTGTNGSYGYPFGVGNHVIYAGMASSSLGNSDIVWEKTETYNAGLDLSMFRNRLTTTIEVFDKLTSDMLLRVPISVSAGVSEAPMTNAGSVSNRGIEFNVNYKGSIRNLKYDLGFNISHIKNEVVSLGTGNEPIYGSYLSESSILDFVTKTEVGRPIGSFYGYVTDGIFNTYEEIEASAQYEADKNSFEQTAQPGDFRFKDLNGDNVIDSEDRTFLGSPHPDFMFGVPIALSYKNFDLNIFFYGQYGNKIFNVMDYYLSNAANGNVYADLRDNQWSGQLREDRAYFPLNTTGATVPDLRTSDRNRNFRSSDFLVQDGSYIRLQDVRLNYNFNEAVLNRLSLTGFSVFIGANNLFTWTKYKGFDPEVGKVVGTDSNNLALGVDHGNYPQSRTFTIGFKISL